MMSEEWSKYAKILEREDKEFKRVMQEEVSITSVLFHFPSNLKANERALAGVGIIAQCERSFNYKVIFSSHVMNVYKILLLPRDWIHR